MTTTTPAPLHLACHCQAHVLRLTLPAPPTGGDVCDCSHCLKRRTVWFCAPANSIEVVRGFGDDLAEYRFGSKSFPHKFCGKCGTQLIGQDLVLDKPIMLNLRAIRDPSFDLWALPMNKFDGLTRDPPYTQPTLADLPGAAEYLEERAKDYTHETRTYVGSCHCKAVTFAVRCKPLEEVKITDCACSMCLGNGALWVYPSRRDTFFEPHGSAPYEPAPGLLAKHTFNTNENAHFVCTTCGCHVFEYCTRPADDPRPPQARKTPWGPENGWNGSFGLNVALLNDAGKFLEDVHALGADLATEEGRKGVVLKGLEREAWPRTDEPVYKLRL